MCIHILTSVLTLIQFDEQTQFKQKEMKKILHKRILHLSSSSFA